MMPASAISSNTWAASPGMSGKPEHRDARLRHVQADVLDDQLLHLFHAGDDLRGAVAAGRGGSLAGCGRRLGLLLELEFAVDGPQGLQGVLAGRPAPKS